MVGDVKEYKTLKDVMPTEFMCGSYDDTIAFKMADIIVMIEHCAFWEQDEYIPWPGKQKNVYFWAELENGYAVGWNENPSRGWSFPVMKYSKT